jgi:hypothetical protein
MKAFIATALLATTGFAAKHSLMSYDKSGDHYTTKTSDDGTDSYYYGWSWESSSDLYISATQPVDWTSDNSGIYFEQLGLFEASSANTLTVVPHSDYLSFYLGFTLYPFSFSFFDNVLTVTLGELADLTSAEGFSVCDMLSWSY